MARNSFSRFGSTLAGCSAPQSSRWTRLGEEADRLGRSLYALRGLLLVLGIFGLLMVVPPQTSEVLRSVGADPEYYTFFELPLHTMITTVAIILFGLATLTFSRPPEIVPADGGIRLKRARVIDSRQLGVVMVVASIVPGVVGLGLLEARIPGDASPPAVAGLNGHLALYGWVNIILGAIVAGIGTLFILARADLVIFAREHLDLPKKPFWFMLGYTVLLWAMFVFLARYNVGLTSVIPVAVLVRLGVILGVVSLLVVAGATLRLPLLGLAAFWLLALSAVDANEHNVVRNIPSEAGPPPDARTAFGEWLTARPPRRGRQPVLIVATEGGGMRAAVMTAMVLDELRARYPTFTQQLYAIVGVSGGSLGAAAFAAAVKDGLPCATAAEAAGLVTGRPPNWQAALHVDMLSAPVRRLLGLDLLSKFVPTALMDLSEWDRARALEDAWRDGWRDALPGRPGIDRPFASFRPRPTDSQPALLLMTTGVATGGPMAISHITLPGMPTLASEASGWDVPLMTAAVMSARFPIVTPAARLPVPIVTPAARLPGGEAPRRFVDGGYFENSGLTPAINLVREIAATGPIDRVRVVVIRIANSDARETYATGGLGLGFSGLTAPLAALNHTREAHGQRAVAELAERVEAARPCRDGKACLQLRSLTFRLEPAEVPIPLGWWLSAAGRREIARQLSAGRNQAEFASVGRELGEAATISGSSNVSCR